MDIFTMTYIVQQFNMSIWVYAGVIVGRTLMLYALQAWVMTGRNAPRQVSAARPNGIE